MNNKMDKKIQDCIKAIGLNDTEEYGIEDECGNFIPSGGGCYHMLMHLDSGHIITFHTSDDDIEISYNKWSSIQDYYDIEEGFPHDDLELVDFEGGMGWEYKSPYYNTRTTTLMLAFSSVPNFLDLIDKVCSNWFWTPMRYIEETKEYWSKELDFAKDQIVNEWMLEYERDDTSLVKEFNKASNELDRWSIRKRRLDEIEDARNECVEGFQDCIEYTNPKIREAFKSRGFVDGTWRNSISPSFELWIDEESPITQDILYLVYFPNLTREDNPSELQDEQFNHYTIELIVNGDNVICGNNIHEDGLHFDTYEDVLGFFYSNTTLYNYKLAIDKEVK